MNISPAVRLSIGLVAITACILTLGTLLGLVPDRTEDALGVRKKISETLAIQVAALASTDQFALMEYTLREMVTRSDEILSGAVRRADGKLVTQVGDHNAWNPPDDNKSTTTHVQIPVFRGQQRWGTVEIRFSPLWQDYAGWLRRSLLGTVLFVVVLGFVAFLFFVKKTLRELDPSSVIPERVKAAFDSLSEGLLILDINERIVLANASITQKLSMEADSFIGKTASDLGWVHENDTPVFYPWTESIRSKKSKHGVTLRIHPDGSTMLTFVVNSTPMLDGKGRIKGALTTFNDMTELDAKNEQLNQILFELRQSQAEIETKNHKLQELASRDSLTGCLNRRAFFSQFETTFAEARRTHSPLACIMVDIDHFKSINDSFGHAVGDKVIQTVVNTLSKGMRPGDLVGRYGGEEICLVVLRAGDEHVIRLSDRLRSLVTAGVMEDAAIPVQRLTASFGVSTLNSGATSPKDLIAQADKALYAAKQQGRDRVVFFEWMGASDTQGDPNLSDAAQTDGAPVSHESNSGTVDSAGGNVIEMPQLYERIRALETLAQQRSRELERATIFDQLTGLPNRLLFADRVGQVIQTANRHRTSAAVLVFELDILERIATTLGRNTADLLLVETARRLKTMLRSTDSIGVVPLDDRDGPTLSRITENGFGIIVGDIADIGSATLIAERIKSALTEPIAIENHEIFLTGNIGMSSYPQDASTAESLLACADTARSNAKGKTGRFRIEHFSKAQNDAAIEQLKIETALYHSLRDQEFLLHYQPVIDLHTGSIVSLEALVRWQTKNGGILPPSHFIPVAENSGIINELGDWIIRTACAQIRSWQDQGFPDVKVAINLSPVQLRSQGFYDIVIRILDEMELNPQALEFEITETLLIENINLVLDQFEMLRNHGIGLLIDDFGSGYSSLSYLRRLPVDAIKVDRTFIKEAHKGTQDFSILAAITAMAHELGIKVLAEGVETQEQLDILMELGIEMMQGYLFSKPLPAVLATELLKQNRDLKSRKRFLKGHSQNQQVR